MNQHRELVLKQVPQQVPQKVPQKVQGDERGAQWQQLGQLLLQLPESQRSAIALYYLQGFSNRETAQILGISVAALESLLARGRRSLQKMAPESEKKTR